MDKIEKKKIGKRVWDIVSTTLVVILFIFVAILIYMKFSGRTIYFFGYRFDVVMTDSMSEKNEEYAEFLKGHDQIQPMDVVISQELNDDVPLDVYDVVIYKDPTIGTNMHRIVDKETLGDKTEFASVTRSRYQNQDVLVFGELKSRITISSIHFDGIEIISYSPQPYDSFYAVNFLSNQKTLQYQTTLLPEGYYKNTITLENTTKAIGNLNIVRNKASGEDYISSIKVKGPKKNIVITKESVQQDGDSSLLYNIYERYEIRGDKSNTADGWFLREDIYSKQLATLPKFGYPIYYLTSIWGILMIVGVALLLTFVSYFWDKINLSKEMKDTLTKGL